MQQSSLSNPTRSICIYKDKITYICIVFDKNLSTRQKKGGFILIFGPLNF